MVPRPWDLWSLLDSSHDLTRAVFFLCSRARFVEFRLLGVLDVADILYIPPHILTFSCIYPSRLLLMTRSYGNEVMIIFPGPLRSRIFNSTFFALPHPNVPQSGVERIPWAEANPGVSTFSNGSAAGL